MVISMAKLSFVTPAPTFHGAAIPDEVGGKVQAYVFSRSRGKNKAAAKLYVQHGAGVVISTRNRGNGVDERRLLLQQQQESKMYEEKADGCPWRHRL